MERIGKVVYRLQVPEGSRVHPVFHVSLLKLKVGGHDSTSGLLPELPLIPKPEPERVVNHRTKGQREKVLVAWRGEPDKEATWEDLKEFNRDYPGFVIDP